MQMLPASSTLATRAWYVVHTKPRQEARALENLQNQGYECFLPTMQIEKRRQQRVQVECMELVGQPQQLKLAPKALSSAFMC